MKLSKIRFPVLLLAGVFLGGALSVAADAPRAEPQQTQTREIYYFQHRLLPQWTHGTDGEFFADLSAGKTDRLKAAAAEIIGADFAEQITVTSHGEKNAVLISFAKPAEPPLCYHVLVLKRGADFHYITLEMTQDLLGNGSVTVLGEWTSDGRHLNKGPRTYTDVESFMREALDTAAVERK